MECSFCGAKNTSEEPFCKACSAPLTAVRRNTRALTQTLRPVIHIQAIGSRLQHGRYEIQRILGRGGMGAVLLAIDHRLAKKLVVIKELIFYSTSTARLHSEVRNFKQEAAMLAHLNHPLIPAVSDHFQEGSHYFMVMEYIEGKNLEELLEQPMAEFEVLAYASEVLDALEYLARQRPPIVHRDIKPANIIISAKDGRAHLVDFGIAANNFNTRQSTPMGTPGYSPPEQYQGKAEAGSDLYALAATMHHIFTGRDPRDHPRFDFPLARSINPHLSLEVEQTLSRALTISPADRYQSATEMKQDIDSLLLTRFGINGYYSSQISKGLSLPGTASMGKSGATLPVLPIVDTGATSQQVALEQKFITTEHTVAADASRLPGGLRRTQQAQLPTPPMSTDQSAAIPMLRDTASGEYPADLVQRKNNRIVIAISLILILALAFAAWSTNSKRQTLQGTPTLSSNSLAGIGVTKTAGGEVIGISDGSYIFDTSGPSANLKEQAANSLLHHDSASALSLLSEAQKQDPRDAEALIYHEDLRVSADAKYITVVLGTTLTGDPNSIAIGHDNLQGAYLAQKAYNDQALTHGGVGLRLLIANSGSQFQDASSVAKQIVQLAQQDKSVVAVMGWTLSAQTLEAIPLLSQAHLPVVSMAAADNLSDLSDYFFRIGNSAAIQAKVGAQYAISTLKAKKAVIFVDNTNDYSRSMTDDFRTSFTSLGGSIIATESYKIGDATTNIGRLTTETQDALQKHPDIIYFPGYPADASVLLQHMKPSDPIILGGNVLYEPGDYTDVPVSGLSHLRITAQAHPDEWDFLKLSAHKPVFFKEYQQAFGPSSTQATRPTSGVMLAYDAIQALLEASKLALKNAYPFTSLDMQQSLAAVSGPDAFQGVTGPIALGHDDSSTRAVAMVCNKDGNFVLDTVLGQLVLNGTVYTKYPAKSVCA